MSLEPLTDDRLERHDSLYLFAKKSTGLSYSNLLISYTHSFFGWNFQRFEIFPKKDEFRFWYMPKLSFAFDAPKHLHYEPQHFIQIIRSWYCSQDFCLSPYKGICRRCYQAFCYRHLNKKTGYCKACKKEIKINIGQRSPRKARLMEVKQWV